MLLVGHSNRIPSDDCLVVETDKPRYERLKWRMLFLVMVCYASYYTGRQNFGFAAKYLASDLHLSAVQIGTISAGLLLSYAVGGLIAGFLGDLVGCRLLVTVGLLASFALNWATSFGNNFAEVLTFWMLNGLAQATGWSPCARIVGNWWPRSQRGTSFGLLLFAASCSILLTYAICLASLEAGGWRYVFRLPVLMMLPAACVFLFLVFDSPAAAGLQTRILRQKISLSIREAYGPLLRQPLFLLTCASIGFESVARYGLLVWIPIHLLGKDWRASGAGKWITLLLPLGMALGAACTGLISDGLFKAHWPRPIVFLMGAGALIAFLLGVTPRSELLPAGLLLIAAGFCVYGPQAAYWSLARQFGGLPRASTATGLLDASAYVFAAAGEIFIGRMVDFTGTTGSIFPVIAGSCLLSSILMLPLASKSISHIGIHD